MNISFNAYIKYLLVITAIFFTACNKDKELKVVENDRLNIELAMTIEQEGSFDKLFDDIQYIPLETGDDYLLDGRSAIKYIDSDNILIESGCELYRFGRNGKFINRIGKNGQGPNEYAYPGAVSVDPETKLLYLFNNKRLQVWTFEGEFIRAIAIDDPREPVMGVAFDGSRLITVFREFTGDGGVCSTLAWLDHSGKVVHEETLYRDDTKVDVVMWGSPAHDRLNDKHLLKEEWGTTIYAINNKGYEPFYTIDLGKLTPSRKDLQGREERKLLYHNYAVLDRFNLGEKYFWLTIFNKENMYEIIIDMHKGSLLHSRRYKEKPEVGFGIVNHRIPGMAIWPQFIDIAGEAYMLLQPSKLTSEELSSLNPLFNNDIEVDEFSNPILVHIK